MSVPYPDMSDKLFQPIEMVVIAKKKRKRSLYQVLGQLDAPEMLNPPLHQWNKSQLHIASGIETLRTRRYKTAVDEPAR